MNIKETKWQKGKQVTFCDQKDMGKRPWGEEKLICYIPDKFLMKRLFLKKGSKGGFQYHRVKDEAGILISGKLLVRFDDGAGGVTSKTVFPGESFHFAPGIVHQEEALEDCVIIEGSTTVFNDRVRMDKEYGFGEPIGMPTTTLEEIKFDL